MAGVALVRVLCLCVRVCVQACMHVLCVCVRFPAILVLEHQRADVVNAEAAVSVCTVVTLCLLTIACVCLPVRMGVCVCVCTCACAWRSVRVRSGVHARFAVIDVRVYV